VPEVAAAATRTCGRTSPPASRLGLDHEARQEDGGWPEPRLPHERDESADSQQQGDTQPSEIGRKAFEDIRAGRVDTDRGPVLEELFRTKLQRNDQPSGPRKTKRTR
jgi:hypothetical protein